MRWLGLFAPYTDELGNGINEFVSALSLVRKAGGWTIAAELDFVLIIFPRIERNGLDIVSVGDHEGPPD